MENLNRLDRCIQEFDNCLRVITGTAKAQRPWPVPPDIAADALLDTVQKKHAGGLMRVNHVGEICAQALYQAQKMMASSPDVKTMFAHAANEEIDHLDWTAQRLKELDARPSVLNPLWYAGALATGCVVGCFGDRFNLGFMAETERQVEQHLASHLEQLPATDTRSRAIVEEMRADEIAHGRAAAEAGGAELPRPVKALMAGMSNIMKRTAYYF